MPRFWFLDNTALEQFIENELRFGLSVAVEAKVLTDIAGTSGIQSQSYSTSVLTTVRKAITKLGISGYSPASIMLHPTDFEGIELALSSTTAVEFQGLPYDLASSRLYRVPIVATVSRPLAPRTFSPRVRSLLIRIRRVWVCSGPSRPTPTTSPRT